ncbi:hypothetical protein TNCV_43151 [Trichonephila clavipes]|nr:hypothetical protein TNCV_43151 [Trichonephila clavipes]
MHLKSAVAQSFRVKVVWKIREWGPGWLKCQPRHLAEVQSYEGLGSKPGEDRDICKCIVPSWHGSTINNRRAACPLVRLVEGEERWEAPDYHQVSSLKIGVETSQIVMSSAWCSKL